MALKVELKPGERFILGESVITNDKQRTRLYIEGNAPILREKDIIRPEEADTPCRKIYLVVQMMYLAHSPRDHHELYFKLVSDLMAAAPSMATHLDLINNHILTDSYYKALKEAKAMIAYEGTLLNNATCSASV
jgi:flagellar protein FlbT